MTDLAFLLAPAIAFAVACGAPGPATLGVAATAMAQGAGAAARFSLGLALVLALWGALVAAGLGPLLLASAAALTVLKIGGGLFLLWLAFGAARSAMRPGGAPAPAAARRHFARGALLNAMNPKAILAWAAVIALGLGPETTGAQIWAIWAVCSAIGLLIYLGYSLAFAAPPARRLYARARRGIEAATAALFGLAGLRLLTWRPEAP
ncbi:MAG: LysE family translocator [Pikeienuella sp.]|uniref:LysE family translocator n=1 Tax=Pikeienuella sp. TaxID=2831957 RepID=UPI00391DA647